MAAFSCLRGADLRPGRRLLIYGASGSIGSAAAQVAKSIGADVTAVCRTQNVELVRPLGADQVIDHTREKYIRKGETYDVIFDAVGKNSFRRCRRGLKPGGLLIETDAGFMAHAPLLALVTHWIGDKRVIMGITRYTKADLLVLKELILAGKYRMVIDRIYPFEQVVEATRYVETGQKTGNVVLTVSDDHRA
jgi:NADPH:quinone reductase-like Zn-dependent oxidoreductase